MKIKINSGLTAHPKHQIEKIIQLVELGEDFELSTNSDFIIRELNCLIMNSSILPTDIIALEDGLVLNVDDFGFEIKSIDDVIEEQNIRSGELYYKLKYKDEIN